MKKRNIIFNDKYKKQSTTKQVIKKETNITSPSKRIKTIEWKFEVNQLVYVKTHEGKKLGIIIANERFRKRQLEQNIYVVLINNVISNVQGGQIRNI